MGMLSTSVDDLDKRILMLLQLNCRLSFAGLSREIGSAEATVRFSVNRLVSERGTTRFAALLDPAKPGR